MASGEGRFSGPKTGLEIAVKKGCMWLVDAKPLRSASGMGGKETSGCAASPPRTPRPPRAPIPHSLLRRSGLIERFKEDDTFRARVIDGLYVAGFGAVFFLAAYLLVLA